MLTEINTSDFAALKAAVEEYPRLCGYYIIGLVSVRELRDSGADQEKLIDLLYDHFEDDPHEVDPDFVTDEKWSDYETSIEDARAHTMEALVGGNSIGHINETMPESKAASLFDQFVALCGSNPRFYTRLGFGNHEHVFQHGVLVVADDLAGTLWIVESD